MAIHPDLKSMLKESLPEYLLVAEYCVTYRKDADWGQEQAGGCLGYPAAVMLFSIVDTIGSYYRGNSSLSISVDGKPVSIRKDGFQHFYILNSEYYSQNLAESTIKRLYKNFRSLLMHNAALAPQHVLLCSPSEKDLFPTVASRQGVNLFPFLAISWGAVKLFTERIDNVVPGSDQAENIEHKRG